MQRLVSVLGGVVLVGLGVSPGWGGTVAPLRVISPGSPFAPGCEGVPQPGSTVYQNAEVEPWVDVNPTDSRNLIAVWQQDRWSNGRSEEHTSELQSHHDLVCRLLLEKKKKQIKNRKTSAP